MEEGRRLLIGMVGVTQVASLNPCCNGRGSKTNVQLTLDKAIPVLILVVMEEGQRRLKLVGFIVLYRVLILVVMEEGQRHRKEYRKEHIHCLNPCCNGRGSKTTCKDICA